MTNPTDRQFNWSLKKKICSKLSKFEMIPFDREYTAVTFDREYTAVTSRAAVGGWAAELNIYVFLFRKAYVSRHACTHNVSGLFFDQMHTVHINTLFYISHLEDVKEYSSAPEGWLRLTGMDHAWSMLQLLSNNGHLDIPPKMPNLCSTAGKACAFEWTQGESNLNTTQPYNVW
jgi:hypothetical protein